MSRAAIFFVDRTRKFPSVKTESTWAPPSSVCIYHINIKCMPANICAFATQIAERLPRPSTPCGCDQTDGEGTRLSNQPSPLVPNRSCPPAHQAIQLNFGPRIYGSIYIRAVLMLMGSGTIVSVGALSQRINRRHLSSVRQAPSIALRSNTSASPSAWDTCL